jgi:hypothetical protein
MTWAIPPSSTKVTDLDQTRCDWPTGNLFCCDVDHFKGHFLNNVSILLTYLDNNFKCGPFFTNTLPRVSYVSMHIHSTSFEVKFKGNVALCLIEYHDIKTYCSVYSRCYGTIVRWEVSGQRLGKHVPEETVTHATGETWCRLRGLRRGVIKKRTGANKWVDSWQSVLYGTWAIVGSSYQETSSEDIAGWKRLSVCSSDV